MPVTAAGLKENIELSLDAYFRATLATAESLHVHLNNDPVFTAEGKSQWVGVSYGLLSALRADTTTLSVYKTSRVWGWLEFTLCTRTPAIRTNKYAPARLYDKVYRHVESPKSIPIRDYQPADDPIVGYVHCWECKERLVDTGDESGVYQYSLSVDSEYLELRT